LSIEPVESYARIGCFSYTYADAAEKAYSDYLRYSSEIRKFGDVEYDGELEEFKHLKGLAGLQVIVFSAMCFEAAIYDFSSIHLGDDYVRDNLDKLDLLSKWVVALRFVAGIELKKSESAYGLLKTLIQARNKLVHAKSESFEFEVNAQRRQIDRANKLNAEYELNVHVAFRALVTMSLYFDASTQGHHNPLPPYDPINAPLRRYYPELKSVIEQCRRSATNNKSS
jgi:hypothetical protein